MNDVKRLAKAINILAELRDAAYSVLCESNGVFDNSWRRVGADGEFDWEMEFPVTGYGKTLDKLSKASSKAGAFLEPEEAEKRVKWENACSTASAIVKLFEEGLARGDTHPNLVRSSLHRNIADAINGTLKAADGKLSETMDDLLAALVSKGELVKFTASGIAESGDAQ